MFVHGRVRGGGSAAGIAGRRPQPAGRRVPAVGSVSGHRADVVEGVAGAFVERGVV